MTIHVDDELLVQAKAQAATVGVTLAQLIADTLCASLRRREHAEHRRRVIPGRDKQDSPCLIFPPTSCHEAKTGTQCFSRRRILSRP